MKKLIVGLLAVFLMIAGLVGVSGTSASAAPSDCPYSGCSNTSTVGVGTGVTEKRAGKRNLRYGVIGARVNAVGSNAVPVGKVYLTLKKKGSTKVKYRDSGNVDQRGKIRFRTPRLAKRPTWIYLVQFKNNQANGWNNSRDKGSFTF